MDPFVPSNRSLDTDLIILRSLFAIDPQTNLPISSLYLLGTDGLGGLNWHDVFYNISSYSKLIGAGVGYLPSTIYATSNATNSFSSILNTGFSSLSSMIALGGIPGSITGQQLYSTTAGITTTTNTLVLSSFQSTTTAYNNGATSFQPNLTSSLIGLGTFGYVSTATLQDTVTNLGDIGYVSSLTLNATSNALAKGTQDNLTSTIKGLTTFGYPSSLSMQSTTAGIYRTVQKNTTSTIDGLATYGYISSSAFQSSIDGLIRTVNVDRAGSLIVYNANVTVSSLQSLAFLSTFYNSSMTYQGVNGLTLGSTTTRDLLFSTATLNFHDNSNYITPQTKLSLEIYPNFVFCHMNLTNTTQLFQMSSFLMYDSNILKNTVVNSLLIANGYALGQSNVFQTPFRMNVAGSDIQAYDHEYRMMHRIEKCMSYNLTGGFTNSNVAIFMASTNSLYYTIINQ